MNKPAPALELARRCRFPGVFVPAEGLAGRARAARRLCAAAGVVLTLAACNHAGGERQSKVVDGIRFDLAVASQPQVSNSLAKVRPYRLLLTLSDAQSGAALADAAAGVQVGGGRRSQDPGGFVAMTPVRQDGAAAYVATVNLTPGDQRLIFRVTTPVHAREFAAPDADRLRSCTNSRRPPFHYSRTANR